MSDQSAQSFGIATGKGGRMNKDRTLFRFGKRVDHVVIANHGTAKVLVDLQVARDPVFYWPDDINGGHGNRTEVVQQTYFYWSINAGVTEKTGPFFARRGLKIKRVHPNGSQVFVEAIVHGVSEGEIQNKDIS